MAGDPLAVRAALALTALVPALPRGLAARAHARQGAPAGRLTERFGVASAPRPAGRLVWVHAASLGEVAAGRGLATALAEAAGAALLLTTATEGGRGGVPPGAIHQFLPVDTPGAVRAFLAHWRPDLGVFVEGDLWPRLVIEAAGRGVPLALVNARASRTRARWPRSMGALLGRMAVVTAQDEGVRRDLLALGLDPARVHATGDLRAAAPPLPADPEALAALTEALAGRPAWIAASTHPADEAPVLAAHIAARAARPLLLWAPRHPARADAVEAAARRHGLAVARRSREEAPGPEVDVMLWDRLGDMGLLYRLAPIAFLGGSFGDEGGHNPHEPARLGCAVLSGPRVANHRAAFAALEAAGGARIVADGAGLGVALLEAQGLPLDRMRAAARAVAEAGSGAEAATLRLLLPLLAGRPPGA